MKSIWNWLIVFVVFVVLMLAANFFLPEGADTLDFTGLAWIVWALLAVVGVYVVYFFTKDSDAWVIGTREVVYMGIGAALYGIFAFLFNGSVIALPSISLISYRPAMAILVFSATLPK